VPSVSRPFRVLSRLLVLLMVPVVIIAGPNVGTAAAAVKHSGATAAGVSWDNWIPGEWARCDATFQYRMDGTALTAVQTIAVSGGDCDTGPSLDLQAGQLTMTASGRTGMGASCSFSGTATLSQDSEAFGTMTLGRLVNLPVTVDHACQVTQICFSVYKDQPPVPGDVNLSQKCDGVSMGAPKMPGGDTPPGSCPVVDLTGARGKEIREPGISYGGEVRPDAWGWEAVARWAGDAPGVEAFLVRRNDATGQVVGYDGYAAGTINGSGVPKKLSHSETWADNEPLFTNHSVIGIQVWVTRDHPGLWGVTDWRSSAENRGATGGDGAANWTLPQSGGAHPYIGTTDVNHCRWYFGEKVATGGDRPAFNDPAGPMTGADDEGGEEPAPVIPVDDPPAAETCDFNLSEPSTWLSGGMCAAVGLLGAIFNLLGGLAAAIFGPIVDAIGALVGGILDGIKALFVPSDGYLDNKMQNAQDQWAETSPALWLDGFSSLVPGGVSGCEGLPLQVGLPGGVDIDESIGAACSGNMANVAALVRIAISAALVIGGGMACVRALGSGFGWSPGVGRVEV
jgi:hypothetical protein